jgi:ribosomal protein L37AE/L43A
MAYCSARKGYITRTINGKGGSMIENVTCKACGLAQESNRKSLPYNWKCKKCGKVQPYRQPVGIIWKTDTGTVKRGSK